MTNETVPHYERKNDSISCIFCNELEENIHLHPEVELIFCLEGKAGIFDMGNQYEITKGQAIIIFPNQMHYYKNIEKSSKFGIVCFSLEMIYGFRKKFFSYNPQKPVFSFDKYPIVSELIGELLQNYSNNDLRSQALLIGFVNTLMYFVHDDIDFIGIEKHNASLVNGILNYCLLNYRDHISVRTIAEYLNTNSNNISRVFNAYMKISIPQYVNYLRVSEACRMLEYTDNTVAEISATVGFGSFRNLNRVFLTILGTTPSDYRKNHQS